MAEHSFTVKCEENVQVYTGIRKGIHKDSKILCVIKDEDVDVVWTLDLPAQRSLKELKRYYFEHSPWVARNWKYVVCRVEDKVWME